MKSSQVWEEFYTMEAMISCQWVEENCRLWHVVTCMAVMFRAVFWVVLPMMEAVRTSETSVDNHFTRPYNPEDSSEHHTRRRENLKSHMHGSVHQ
jgi:hypothetical protein